MTSFIKKYKAFFIGWVITWALVWILEYKGAILIDRQEYLANILGFGFYWFLISILIHKANYLKAHINTLKKLAGLIVLLVVIMVVDANADIPDNPITVLLFTVFYLAVSYSILPKFFTKYRIAILGIYAFAYSVFLYFRLFSESFEVYRQNGKEIFLLFMLPIPVFAGLWTYQQWKWFKNLKAEKAQAELAMLQAQMDPHFFFNTLNNLYALTIKKSEMAPEVILKLSDMMRYTIYEGKKESVLVKDEIEYLSNYIELHKIRYKKNVDIRFKHDVEGQTKVAPLLFIILLENAFKHGVETLSENAYIHIDLSQKENYIYFQIENNYDENEVGTPPGIGLENLTRRLSLLFNKDAEIQIQKKSGRYNSTLKVPVYA